MKTYIWTIPTRLFHWSLALSFTVAFILGGEDDFLSLHAALGTFIGILVFFRVFQGLFGPRYARFRDFPVSPRALIEFVKNMKKSKEDHPGHNPLASLVMLGIFAAALVSFVSGFMLFATSETGMFGIRFNPGGDGEVWEEVHEVVVHLFLILVGIHLTGIAVDTLFHPGNGTIWSIFTGYKKINTVPALNTIGQKFFSIVWFSLPFLAFFYVLIYQPTPADEKENTEQTEGSETDDD
jgi:cytochrome b